MAWAQVGPELCGPLYAPTTNKPRDYREEHRDLKPLVENAHFTPSVEFLIRGRTNQVVGPDLHYTLTMFPNHYRALIAVTKLGQRNPFPERVGLPLPVECYFERGLRFVPDDLLVRMLYAKYLIGVGRKDDAMRQLEHTRAAAGDSAITHRNIGLVYLEMKDYEHALEQAHRVMALAPDDPTLRDELMKVDRWRPPAPVAAASAPASAPK